MDMATDFIADFGKNFETMSPYDRMVHTKTAMEVIRHASSGGPEHFNTVATHVVGLIDAMRKSKAEGVAKQFQHNIADTDTHFYEHVCLTAQANKVELFELETFVIAPPQHHFADLYDPARYKHKAAPRN